MFQLRLIFPDNYYSGVFDPKRGRMDCALLGISAPTLPEVSDQNSASPSKRFEILEDCGISCNYQPINIGKHKLFKIVSFLTGK